MSYARQAAAKIAVSRSLDREGQGGHANDRKENKCSEIAILLSGSMLYFFNRRGKRGSLEICKEIDHISENLKECFWYNGDKNENLTTDFFRYSKNQNNGYEKQGGIARMKSDKNALILYHGSPNKEIQPTYGLGNDKHDYGKGFYLTESPALAFEWSVCNPTENNGWVHKYTLDAAELNILDFQEYDVLSWLAELMKHRDADTGRRYKVLAPRFIEKYQISTEGYDVTMDAESLFDYFLKNDKYELKQGKETGGFAPDWIGQFYALFQWMYRMPSKEVVRLLPVKFMFEGYPGLHDLDLQVAVQKVGEQCGLGKQE